LPDSREDLDHGGGCLVTTEVLPDGEGFRTQNLTNIYETNHAAMVLLVPVVSRNDAVHLIGNTDVNNFSFPSVNFGFHNYRITIIEFFKWMTIGHQNRHPRNLDAEESQFC
jgi:hypothetical protein